MFNKKIFAITTIAGLLLTGGVALAQGVKMGMNVSVSDSGSVKLVGKVSSVSGSTVAVSSWGGLWSVNTTGATITGSQKQAITLADVKVGDQVKVAGTVASNALTVQATSLVNLSVPPVSQNTKTVVGIMTNLNTSAGTFTLTPRFTFLNNSVNVITNSSTQVFLNGTASTLASLSNTMGVTLKGTYDTNTNTFTATTINAYNQRLMGFEKEKGLGWGLLFKMGFGKDKD